MDGEQTRASLVRWTDARTAAPPGAADPGSVAVAALAFALTEALRCEAPPALGVALHARLRRAEPAAPVGPVWSDLALAVVAATTVVALVAWAALFGDLLSTLRIGDAAVFETLPLLFGQATTSAALFWAERVAQQASLLALAATGWFTITRLVPEPRGDER